MTTLEMSLAGYEQKVDTLAAELEKGIQSWSENLVKTTLGQLNELFNKLPNVTWGMQNYPLPQRIVDLFNKGESHLPWEERAKEELFK